MDDRAIGIFDSGLGGLTAVKELLASMPNEDLIYFGDTGRVPYGTRSVETIERYATEDIEFLASKDVKLIIAACGTVSAVALPKVKKAYSIPIIGVVESAVAVAIEKAGNKKIGVIGTSATIRSDVYKKTIHQINESFEVLQVACPLFVPIVENGMIERDNPISKLIVEKYLKELKEQHIGALILGCTHFPLLEELIDDFFENKIALINSGAEVAVRAKKMIFQMNIESSKTEEGKRIFYISDSVDDFYKMSEMIFHRSDFTSIERVTVDKIN